MLKSFYVQGYRSFGARLNIKDLQQTTVIYGLNNSGKTNLLRAIELFSHLMKLPLVNLTGPGFIEPLERFQERTGQSEAMFSRHPTPATRINIGGQLSSGDEIDLVIHLEGTSIRVELAGWAKGGEDRAKPYGKALKNEKERQAHLASLTADKQSLEVLAKTPTFGIKVLDNLTWQQGRNKLAELDSLRQIEDKQKRFSNDWSQLGQQANYKLITPKIPVSATVRSDISHRLRSATVADRLRTKRLIRSFSEIAIGLPPGELDEFAHPPTYPEDFGWVTERAVIPLDDLGSGAQWIFALIAELALLPGSATLLIDEPESHLNARLQDDLCVWLIKWSQTEGTETQIVMASHSLNFARSAWDLREIKHSDNSTTVIQVTPSRLVGMAPNLPSDQLHPGQFDGLVGHDGSVKLPEDVRHTLRIRPGQYVYFVKGEDTKYEIVSQEEMDRLLGTGDQVGEGT